MYRIVSSVHLVALLKLITALIQTFTKQRAETANMNCQEVRIRQSQFKPPTSKSHGTV